MIDIFSLMEQEYEGIQYTEEKTPISREDWHRQRLGKLTCSRFDDMMVSGRGKDDKFGKACMTYVYEKVAELLTQSPHIVTSQIIIS